MAAALSSAMVGGPCVGRQWGRGNTTTSDKTMSNGAVTMMMRSRGDAASRKAMGTAGVRMPVTTLAMVNGQSRNNGGLCRAGAASCSVGDQFGTGTGRPLGLGMRRGTTTMGVMPAKGAFHAAALACGAPIASRSSSSSRAAVVAKAADAAGEVDKSKKYQNVGVFNVATEKLPGGDRLSNEGILGFVLAGFLALWLGTAAVRTFAVMIGFIFTCAKYIAMGVAILLIGVAVS